MSSYDGMLRDNVPTGRRERWNASTSQWADVGPIPDDRGGTVTAIPDRVARALGAREPDHALDTEGSRTPQRIIDDLAHAGLCVVDQAALSRLADRLDVEVGMATDALRSVVLRGEEAPLITLGRRWSDADAATEEAP